MEYNDYELVSLAQEHNETALNILYKNYNKIIINKSKKAQKYLKQSGLDITDIIQEAILGFNSAIMTYNQNNNAKFYTFAILCIERQLNNLIIKNTRGKVKILNEAVALDSPNEDGNNLYDFLSDNISPEIELFEDEKTSELYNLITTLLTNTETLVFELKINGYTYKEIGNILDMNIKDIYNAMERIRNKVSKLLYG